MARRILIVGDPADEGLQMLAGVSSTDEFERLFDFVPSLADRGVYGVWYAVFVGISAFSEVFPKAKLPYFEYRAGFAVIPHPAAIMDAVIYRRAASFMKCLAARRGAGDRTKSGTIYVSARRTTPPVYYELFGDVDPLWSKRRRRRA